MITNTSLNHKKNVLLYVVVIKYVLCLTYRHFSSGGIRFIIKHFYAIKL